MADFIPTELEGWDEIIELAGRDNTPAQGQAAAKAAQKQAYALANLGNDISSMKKVVGTRIESLTESLNENAKANEKVSKRTFWLTIVLVIATIVQAVAAVVAVSVAAGK